MQFGDSPFQTLKSLKIEPITKVVFVSDLFVEQYVGGAELTTDALIQKCEYPYQKILSKDVTLQLLEQGHQAFWIFGNFAGLNFQLIPSIVANMKYAVLEYDYKYCRYRSPEKHKFAEGVTCECHNEMTGKLVSALYLGAKHLFWMSEAQMEHYFQKFDFLRQAMIEGKSPKSTVLSSVFDDTFFVNLKILREQAKSQQRKGWIVLGSTSWVKGFDAAKKWCEDNDKQYEVVWNVPYDELLKKLSVAECFVYLPEGADTCPRMVIEAKLLECQLHLNDNVQHKNEEWFSGNLQDAEEYLFANRELFWRSVKEHIDYVPTISGYVTTLNCIDQKYPIEECILSMVNFCDEVIVVDGGSTDRTIDLLKKIQIHFVKNTACLTGSGDDIEWLNQYSKVKVHLIPRDWNDTRFAVFDGAQKAEARKLCTKEFCWQMDADEILPLDDGEKVKNLCKNWPAMVELVSLPVIEYWGSENKVRVDVNPWKWRLSKNLPHITHGIPTELRRIDAEGKLYASPGTDGCDYVNTVTGERILHASFYNEDAHNARLAALNGNNEALQAYQGWMQHCANSLPTVRHYSWIDIARKIRTYRDYWSKHWQSLYDIRQEDTPDNNMFFDKRWADVTEEEIDTMAKRLADETGGHIFHAKVDWSKPTPHMVVK